MKPKSMPSGAATYAGSGVSYKDLDQSKVRAQQLATHTLSGVEWLGVKPLEHYRGESSYVFQLPDGSHIATVDEGLGTKIEIANYVYTATSDPYGYYVVGQDTVGMIVNDLATIRIPPISLQMHISVGTGSWLTDSSRVGALYGGWVDATVESGAVWSGGETPALPGIIKKGTAVLAGSATGYLPTPHLPLKENIKVGDVIIGVASDGIMANGISLYRQVADAQPKKLRLEMCLRALVPTLIYSPIIKMLILANIMPSYMIHVTGHGWRKLMRARSPFRYVITKLMPVPPVFTDFQKLGKISTREMWGNYNMGVGWIMIVRKGDVKTVLTLCRDLDFTADVIGHVEEGPKSVVIKPLRGLTFKDDSMKLR
jgi:phosphoribosylformylglycinamidine cyclo-ligase